MKAATKAWIGALVWAAFAVRFVPNLHHGAWAHALLLLAALVLVPLARELLAEENESGWPAQCAAWARLGEFPAALALALSCALAPGTWAALAALPWVGVGALGALAGLGRVRRGGIGRALEKLCGDVALVFLGIGGGWVLADRAGFQPLHFDPAIVALTAVHFHFAGLLLPIGAGVVVREYFFSRFAMRAAVGVILGVPAVAAGITATQLGAGPSIEGAAGWWLGLSGMAVAIFHVRIALDAKAAWVTRGLFFVAGVSLFFGMLLAEIYAVRAFAAPLPWLDLPWMRALHGTANALGFGLCGVLAWRRRWRSVP
jgi:hypothetical protein